MKYTTKDDGRHWLFTIKEYSSEEDDKPRQEGFHLHYTTVSDSLIAYMDEDDLRRYYIHHRCASFMYDMVPDGVTPEKYVFHGEFQGYQTEMSIASVRCSIEKWLTPTPFQYARKELDPKVVCFRMALDEIVSQCLRIQSKQRIPEYMAVRGVKVLLDDPKTGHKYDPYFSHLLKFKI